MDMIVHWGVFKHLRKDVKANPAILIAALLLDLIVLIAFIWVKASSDVFVVIVSASGITLVSAEEKWYLKNNETT
jgi:hypothetical protein